MFEKIKLTVLIPCYNEDRTISKLLQSVIENLKKLKLQHYQIIVVDDNSTDKSLKILSEFANSSEILLIKNEINTGKGGAIKLALNHIVGDFVLIQDADLEYDPKDYKKLLLPFIETNADVVYGSRFIGGGKYIKIHFFWHYLANKILTFACNLCINLNLTDMEVGYKVIRSSIFKRLNLKEKTFGFEPELTIKLAKEKAKFFEVPISYNGRSYEEGKKIKLKDAFIAIFCIIKYTFLSIIK